MKLKDFLDSIAIVLVGSKPMYSNGGEKHPNLCSSCGEDIIGAGNKFMLNWEQGGGMCTTCVKGYRDNVGYYSENEIDKREKRIKRFYLTKKQIAIRKKSTT